jgi:uncharacterized protein with HEPN domain
MMNFIIIGEMVSRLSDKFIEKNNIEWQKIQHHILILQKELQKILDDLFYVYPIKLELEYLIY